MSAFQSYKTLISLRFKLGNLAERQGFEPWILFTGYLVSSEALSTTQPPLPVLYSITIIYIIKNKKIPP